MHDIVHIYLPFFLMLALLSLVGIMLGGFIWLIATFAGAFLGFGLCFLVIRLVEKVTHHKLLR